MYFTDLQQYVSHLEKMGDLVRIHQSVDPYLEIAAIIDRVSKGHSDNRALLFENVKGSRFPLTANLFGSPQRLAVALGVDDVEEFAEQLRLDLSAYKDLDSSAALLSVVQAKAVQPTTETVPLWVKDGYTNENLDALPILHSWPEDGGRYLTLAQVFTRHPEESTQNCGMYRVQIIDNQSALIRCHPGSGGEAHRQAWHDQGRSMPVVIVLGGPPLLTWCAGVSLPSEVSEFDFASYLSGEPLSVSAPLDSGLVVPSTAEIIIEGFVRPDEVANEGPFGNHTGYYSPMAPAPVLRIESVRVRKGGLYPCTIVGPPPMENGTFAHAAVRLLLPLAQHDLPWIVNVHMPTEGIYHRAAFVAVDAPDLSVEVVSRSLWHTRLLSNSRLIVLLDKDVDLSATKDVYWRLVNSAEWEESLLREDNKLVIDARSSASKIRVAPDRQVEAKVISRWEAYMSGRK